ncbi:MAG: hypothetical protein NZM12_02040, partial [Steroidobacteraceae bacterium]|nr:hypothetical protein [Steroidobacteraceae bacterium]
TLVAMLALRPLAQAIDLVDRPGGHKTHHGEVPIVGGLAMLLGFIVGLGTADKWIPAAPLLGAACTVLVVVGLLDDRFNLSPVVRLFVQMALVAAMVLGAGLKISSVGDPLALGEWVFPKNIDLVVTLLFVAGAINAFNMLDGMDGLASAIAMVSLTAFSAVGAAFAAPSVLVGATLMMGAVAAFLIFNIPARFNRKWRSFMGDGGSTLLGFVLACLAIWASQRPNRIVAPAAILWFVAIPVYELLWTMCRRLLRGASPFKPDREHFHHILLAAGFGVRGAFTILVALAAGYATIGLLLVWLAAPEWFVFATFVATGFLTVRLMYASESILTALPSAWRARLARPVEWPQTSV